jgi:hypothetical protein
MAQINSHATLLGKSYASAIHVKLQRKRESLLKLCLSLGRRFSLALPAGTHPMFTKPASLDALYVKGQVRPPVKGQNAQVSSSKKLLVVISRAF